MFGEDSQNTVHKAGVVRRRRKRNFPIQAILIVVLAICAFFLFLIAIAALEILVLKI
ncbi:MAG: hypothetical protein FWF30_03155 [Coriobacteriia bacterium]|nr:hypothetical protein [Coriobacteriia bacterium]